MSAASSSLEAAVFSQHLRGLVTAVTCFSSRKQQLLRQVAWRRRDDRPAAEQRGLVTAVTWFSSRKQQPGGGVIIDPQLSIAAAKRLQVALSLRRQCLACHGDRISFLRLFLELTQRLFVHVSLNLPPARA